MARTFSCLLSHLHRRLKSIQWIKDLLYRQPTLQSSPVPHDADNEDKDEWHFSLPLRIKMSSPFSSSQRKFISEKVFKRSSSIVDL